MAAVQLRFIYIKLDHHCPHPKVSLLLFHILTHTSYKAHLSAHFKLCLWYKKTIVMHIPWHSHRTALGTGGRVVTVDCSFLPSSFHL